MQLLLASNNVYEFFKPLLGHELKLYGIEALGVLGYMGKKSYDDLVDLQRKDPQIQIISLYNDGYGVNRLKPKATLYYIASMPCDDLVLIVPSLPFKDFSDGEEYWKKQFEAGAANAREALKNWRS